MPICVEPTSRSLSLVNQTGLRTCNCVRRAVAVGTAKWLARIRDRRGGLHHSGPADKPRDRRLQRSYSGKEGGRFAAKTAVPASFTDPNHWSSAERYWRRPLWGKKERVIRGSYVLY